MYGEARDAFQSRLCSTNFPDPISPCASKGKSGGTGKIATAHHAKGSCLCWEHRHSQGEIIFCKCVRRLFQAALRSRKLQRI